MTIEENQYKRITGTDNFGIYIGTDNNGRTSMFVKLKNKPKYRNGNKYLIYDFNKRSDNLWAMTVSISDQRFSGVFDKLVNDLVEITQNKSILLAERIFINRFNEWKTMFDKKVSLDLDYSQMVGLAGELYFLYEYMFKKYGIHESITSWTGPNGAEKDFITNDTWYEIKTKRLNKDTVHVNNQMQLSSESIGYLAIVSYESSSQLNKRATNLLQLYEKINALLETKETQIEFENKLLHLGFIPNENYKEFNFLFHDIDFYMVDSSFPKIHKDDSAHAITNVKYDIYLPGIMQYRIEV
ncbi:PD-(D/E)XK motif protein [Exiguobacterium sp. SH1S21]|uniref:PD-(D/E)XK motif protein n=1 Tax=Exiguobacterium sp. SH1S21 TaxID=2510953 RepID=UPI00103CB36C|nr:PD-(D/E)XK motif protein [Exiguobacterium sp. SH1S21]TCI53776.1 PD-(D/E)XK motif protein [Exiguobacterium sp. SH1S21]